MKSNHIPAKIRISRRISKLIYQEEECWAKHKDRFYQFCRHCDRDIISVNMYGHYSRCPIKGLDKQIEYYKKLLKEAS